MRDTLILRLGKDEFIGIGTALQILPFSNSIEGLNLLFQGI
jgi:hypothetical protein